MESTPSVAQNLLYAKLTFYSIFPGQNIYGRILVVFREHLPTGTPHLHISALAIFAKFFTRFFARIFMIA